MAEARTRDEWNRTACTMALLANLHRDPKKHAPFKPTDFHPLEQRKSQHAGTADVRLLKTVFVRGE